MLKKLFGEVKTGRLNRLAFLGYWVLLTAFMIAMGFAIVLAIGAGEMLIGGDLAEAQETLRKWFTAPTVIVVGLVSMVTLFGHLNIIAKRVRDIGLPGWWVVLLLAIVGVVVSIQISEQASNALSMICFFALLLIPGKVVGSRV